MLALRIDFLAGRYYATPWGHSVNEGIPEWPPSPWRLLRALLSAWHGSGSPSPEVFSRLLTALAQPPGFFVPSSTSGHTRHYMPGYADSTDKVFNSFTAPQGPVFVIWKDALLTAEEQQLLASLLAKLGYLGRSESWVEMDLEKDPPIPNLEPVGPGEDTDTQLLCSMGRGDWTEKRGEIVVAEEQRLRSEKEAAGKKPVLSPKERKALDLIAPADLGEALSIDTGTLRENGWSLPPASEQVNYRWTSTEPPSSVRGRRKTPRQAVTLARYLVSSDVPPLYTELLPVAERARKILMGIVGARNEKVIPTELSGKMADGHPADGNHTHAFFIPEPCGGSRSVTHLNIYCPGGFPESVKECLPALDKIWGSGGHDIRLTLLTTGTPSDVGGRSQDRSSIMSESREWVSLSPFMPSRHLKIRRSEMHDPWVYAEAVAREIDRAVKEELSFHGLPSPVKVELMPAMPGLGHGIILQGHFTSWLDFRRTRQTGQGSMGSRLPYGVRILFDEPVTGPICIGYACHYGLGLFRSTDGF